MKKQGKVHTFKLICPVEELERRVVAEERAAHGKITDVDKLHEWLKDYSNVNVTSNDVVVNTEALSAAEAVDRILEQTQL